MRLHSYFNDSSLVIQFSRVKTSANISQHMVTYFRSQSINKIEEIQHITVVKPSYNFAFCWVMWSEFRNLLRVDKYSSGCLLR